MSEPAPRQDPNRVATLDAAHRPVRAKWWLAGRTAIVESAQVIGLAKHRGLHPFQAGHVRVGCGTAGGGAEGRDALPGGHRRQRHQRRRLWFGARAGLEVSRCQRRTNQSGLDFVGWPALRTPPKQKRWFAELIVAVDVQNPIAGALRGCTRVYGPPKGLAGDWNSRRPNAACAA